MDLSAGIVQERLGEQCRSASTVTPVPVQSLGKPCGQHCPWGRGSPAACSPRLWAMGCRVFPAPPAGNPTWWEPYPRPGSAEPVWSLLQAGTAVTKWCSSSNEEYKTVLHTAQVPRHEGNRANQVVGVTRQSTGNGKGRQRGRLSAVMSTAGWGMGFLWLLCSLQPRCNHLLE